MWTCRTSDGHSCIVPGTDPIQLELSDSTAFQKAVLKLKPGSLAVGRLVIIKYLSFCINAFTFSIFSICARPQQLKIDLL